MLSSSQFLAFWLYLQIFQISFTAKYVASSNGRFGAWCDVIVNEKVGEPRVTKNILFAHKDIDQKNIQR